MADALCGPSNALQNFQKHSSVDRTLQQDRLVSRQSPGQDFRSGPSQHAGAIDPEFEAFQAGHPPPQPETFQHIPTQHVSPQSFAGPAALPDWAADFQRMHVSSPPPMQHQQRVQQQHNHTASWHQDFLRQQSQSASPVSQLHAGPAMPMHPAGSMMGFGAGQFSRQQPFMAQQDMNAQAKQKEPAFDDAAFASAFDAAAAEMLQAEEEAQAEPQTQDAQQAEAQRPQMSKWEELLGIVLPPEEDPVLAYIKEHAFNEYCRHLISEYLPLARGRDPNVIPNCSLASLYLGVMEKLAAKGFPGLRPDPKFCALLNQIKDSEELYYEEQFMFKARAHRLFSMICARNPEYFSGRIRERTPRETDPRQLREMRSKMYVKSVTDMATVTARERQELEVEKYNQLIARVGMDSPLFPVEASRNITARDTRSTILSERSHLEERRRALSRETYPRALGLQRPPQPMQQPIPEQQQQQPQQTPLSNDDAELARTAGQLVESVSHDTSQKFVQSRFLALMRQLRDHEVRVDGDKIVETTPSTIPANQQDLDLGRNGGGDINRTMTGALQTNGNDANEAGELRA